MRGRVAFDIRFDVLGAARGREMVRFLFAEGDWSSSYRDATVLVISKRHRALVQALQREEGARVVYADERTTVLTRPLE